MTKLSSTTSEAKQTPTMVRITPGRAEPTLKLLRETLTHVTGDQAEGDRIAWALLRLWAGTVLRMPTLSDVERLSRDEAVTKRLRRDPSPAAVQHVAAHHGRPVRDIAKGFRDRSGTGLAAERARRSSTPGLPCRAPRFNRWRRTISV